MHSSRRDNTTNMLGVALPFAVQAQMTEAQATLQSELTTLQEQHAALQASTETSQVRACCEVVVVVVTAVTLWSCFISWEC
jgi:hypothetical protein